MKLNRQNRNYTKAYRRLAEPDFNNIEFNLGLDYVESRFAAMRLYDFKKSTVFWNWWCQQMENISQEAFYTTHIESTELSLINLEVEGLKNVWIRCFRNFLKLNITPSETVIKKILDEFKTKLTARNTANKSAVSEQSESPQYATAY